MTSDPIKELLLSVGSSLRAKQLKVDEPIQAVERALVSYRQAVHQSLAAEFSREHRLGSLNGPAQKPDKVAEELLSAVRALPELTAKSAQVRSAKEPDAALEQAPPALPRVTAPAFPDGLTLVGAAVARGPVVIVGGLMRQERLGRLPKALLSKIEWIDTNRGGAHAIGNLAQRIRHKRVAALIIIDGQVSHKHTDPVLAAAREVNVPAAYAGKGGQNALLRAVLELEKMLSHGT